MGFFGFDGASQLPVIFPVDAYVLPQNRYSWIMAAVFEPRFYRNEIFYELGQGYSRVKIFLRIFYFSGDCISMI